MLLDWTSYNPYFRTLQIAQNLVPLLLMNKWGGGDNEKSTNILQNHNNIFENSYFSCLLYNFYAKWLYNNNNNIFYICYWSVRGSGFSSEIKEIILNFPREYITLIIKLTKLIFDAKLSDKIKTALWILVISLFLILFCCHELSR